jgi:ferredoxin
MAGQRTILVCSCEDTMAPDTKLLRRACADAAVIGGRQLCRVELDRVRAALASEASVTICCLQEEPLFREIAGERDSEPTFVNLRETAGWSIEGAAAGPKMAALVAAAAEPMPPTPFVELASEGVILVYGCDDRAIEAAGLLKDHLDVTVMIAGDAEIVPPRSNHFPIVKGRIRSAKGYLGAFEIVVDDYAVPSPSSRAKLVFGPSRDGATSRCDILLDLSGRAPLFPADDLRDGYLRADPGDPTGVLTAILRARDLRGSFDKPRYIAFAEGLCAHSRSGIVGCRRCLDLCPTGAIMPAGDHVAIDEKICAGCGQCAAACPTGAASYAFPPVDALVRKIRTMLTAYREAGGSNPVLLLHDEPHGGALIDALARHGDGLPANVLPLAVNELTQIGLETIAAAFAYGASAMRFLMRQKPRHDPAGLMKTIELAGTALHGLGLTGPRVATMETDDPFEVGEQLRRIEPVAAVSQPASFLPLGSKRSVLRLSLSELHRAAPAPVDVIVLPAGAPFGTVRVDVEGCTLCLSCVSACPTGALSDDPEMPRLRFTEDACVQCGLCKATCPEKVISLEPRLNFSPAAATACVLKEEEPFHCIRCNKPFGVKSMIERIVAKLEGNHWMFPDSAKRLDVIRMCADCRVIAVMAEDFDPHSAQARPKPRTSDDYLRERQTKPTDSG